MNLIERVTAILLKPQQTWPVIEAEQTTVGDLYKNYIAPLACIPAVAGFIGLSIVGITGIVSFRVPIVTGLVNMVVGYVLALVMVYVLSLIVNALAPKFGGEQNSINALKLVAFGLTASFVGGIFSIIPALTALGVVAALYSVYLIYCGLPVLMKCPQDKAVAYTAVVIVCGVVATIVVSFLTALVTPNPLSGSLVGGKGGSGAGDVTIKIPGTEISINSRQMEEASKKMEEAGKKAEAAAAKGDGQAAAEAATAMLGAVLTAATGQKGAGGVAIATDQLKPFAPATLGGMSRTSMEAQSESIVGMEQNTVKASYGRDTKTIAVEISDYGDLGRLAAGAWSQKTLDRDGPDEVERIYRKGARAYNEKWRKDGSYATLEAILDNGVHVSLTGNGVDIKVLYAALDAMGSNQLAAIARQPKK